MWLAASVEKRGGRVYLVVTCDIHGSYVTENSRDADWFRHLHRRQFEGA